jgi:predicted SnoaL-like aldol condensation-catalyzing enzyme
MIKFMSLPLRFNKILTTAKQGLVLVAITAAGILSCQGNEQRNSIDETNMTTVQQLFAHFNKHQWDSMASVYADSALFKDPSLGPSPIWQSRAQIAEKYKALEAMFPDVRDDLKSVFSAEGGRVVVEFVSVGTGPDSTTFTLPICTIFRFEKGKIVEDLTYYDQ